MSEPLDLPPPRKRRRTARYREERNCWMFARLQEGWSYDQVAKHENLTRERVRQIINEILGNREADPTRNHTRLQSARLDPALRLAADLVGKGDPRGIDRMLKVLDRLDKYQAKGAYTADAQYGEDVRAKLYAKIRHAARPLPDFPKSTWKPPARPEQPEAEESAADKERARRENDVSKFFQG
jgi:hypothetical protein